MFTIIWVVVGAITGILAVSISNSKYGLSNKIGDVLHGLVAGAFFGPLTVIVFIFILIS